MDLNSITIASELERLHSTGMFRAKQKQAAENNETVSKRALFDSTNKYFFGLNPDMARDRSGNAKNNVCAMTVAAIAFTDTQWKHMFDDTLDSTAIRNIAFEVKNQAAEKIKEWEIRHCNRKQNDKFKPLKNMRSVASKWKDIVKVLEKTYKTDGQFDAWLKKELGEAVRGRQMSIDETLKRSAAGGGD